MGARLLTSDEVRDALGAAAVGLSDDELVEIARRMRVITTVFREEWSSRRAHARSADGPSVNL